MGFGAWDYAAMGTYLAVVLGMGVCFMHRQKNTEDYFLGGRRMHWLPVAVSMFAALFSAISFLSTPGEAYNHGMMLFLKSVFVLLGVPPAVILFVRFFRRLSLTTAYEYLERRFDLRVRLLASGLFLLLRSFYLGVVLFASAVALGPATGASVWQSIVIVGVVATFYTTLGGMKSVIWVDVLQFIVLLGGILLVLVVLVVKYHAGLGEIWQFARERDHTFGPLGRPEFYSLDPFLRVSLLVVIVSSVFTKLALAGADQISIQRYLSTKNEKDATRSLVWGTALGVPVMFLLFFVGLGLYWFYETHPGCTLRTLRGDEALPHFIAHQLPAGFGGVMMAAIMAAVMSTIDSGLNSLSTCTVTDFYARVVRPDATEAQKLRVAKWLTLFWGAATMASAAAIIWLYGAAEGKNPLVNISEVTIGLFSGILLGVFLLGVLTRRANGDGALVGAAAGLVVALSVTAPFYFRELPPGQKPLSFLWINVLGCLATVAVGYLASLARARPGREKIAGLTYWDTRPAS